MNGVSKGLSVGGIAARASSDSADRIKPALEGEFLPGRGRRRVATVKPTQAGIHRLSDSVIRAAKPTSKPFRLLDGAALYVRVMPNGSKLWRFDFRLKKNKQPFSIGEYPTVSIAQARIAADEAREWVRQGRNPTTARKIKRATNVTKQAIDVKTVAQEWYDSKLKAWSPGHAEAQYRLLVRFVYPAIGSLPVADVETPHLLEALRVVERSGAHELTSKTRQILGQVFRFAVATGRRTTNPVDALKGAFTRPPTIGRPTVEEREFPALFKALHKVPSELTTKLALYFIFATATRPGETRHATWGEIGDIKTKDAQTKKDVTMKVWRIGAERMKMREPFVQPLSALAIEILRRAKTLRQTGEDSELVFPGFTRRGSLSENAFIALLARAGYYGRQTAHGARAAFSSWAHEREFDHAAIEMVLSHRPEGVSGVYNRALYLSARRRILSAWGEHLVECGLRLP
jgi:integrase